MFQFSAVLNGFHYELELAEIYQCTPAVRLTYPLPSQETMTEHFLKIDSILSVGLPLPKKEAKDMRQHSCCSVSKAPCSSSTLRRMPLQKPFHWASFINQTSISKALLNNISKRLGEKLCSEHRALDYYAVFDNAYKDRLLSNCM